MSVFVPSRFWWTGFRAVQGSALSKKYSSLARACAYVMPLSSSCWDGCLVAYPVSVLNWRAHRRSASLESKSRICTHEEAMSHKLEIRVRRPLEPLHPLVDIARLHAIRLGQDANCPLVIPTHRPRELHRELILRLICESAGSASRSEA